MTKKEAINVRGLQKGFGEGFTIDATQTVKLEQLLPISRSLKRFSPLVVVTSLENGPSGRVDILPSASFSQGEVHIFSSVADLMSAAVDKPNGVVIFADWPVGERPIGQESEMTMLKKYLASFGGKGKRVWLVEGPKRFPLDKPAIAVRKNWLKSLGLADIELRSPVADKEQGLRLIYAVARPAIEPKRQKTTILERPYIRPIMWEVAEGLEAKGYEVVSWDDIRGLLSATRFPPDAISRLRLGLGIVVKHPCGICLEFISIQGEIIPMTKCDDEQCAEKEKEIEKIVHRRNRMVLGRDMPYDTCMKCGQQRFISRLTWDDDGSSRWVKIEECITCPSCISGTADHGRRIFSVRRYLPGKTQRLVKFADLEEEEQRLILTRQVRP